jgi:predicted N-acyltransferase
MLNMIFDFKFITSIEQIEKPAWDNLARSSGPFLQYNFLRALEQSGSVGTQTGWQPQHLIIRQEEAVVGILPLYIKTHSYGEYVFDFAWANTFKQYGVNYYPKLISAIPFTPVTGARLMLVEGLSYEQVLQATCKSIQDKLTTSGLSSMHWLFVDHGFSKNLENNKQLSRRSVQFQWFNRGYQDFAAFLSTFNSRKRKSVRNERKKIMNQGVSILRLCADKVTQEAVNFFYLCYQQTYIKRSGHGGYLTKEFFELLYANMQDNIMLVIASKGDTPIASALYLYDNNQLCGRYWGSLEDVSSLHFECCYYQGIEFCIENNIASFNPGTQGEHKILRGFEPIYCYSNHWVKEVAFHDAIDRFLQQESPNIEGYKLGAEKLLPYRQVATEDSS